MNRLQEQELIDAMADIHRLRAELEAAERERQKMRALWEAAHDTCVTLRAECDALKKRAEAQAHRLSQVIEERNEAERADALREQVEAARQALERDENDWTFLFNLHPNVALKPEIRQALAAANLNVIRAALARLDQREHSVHCPANQEVQR